MTRVAAVDSRRSAVVAVRAIAITFAAATAAPAREQVEERVLTADDRSKVAVIGASGVTTVVSEVTAAKVASVVSVVSAVTAAGVGSVASVVSGLIGASVVSVVSDRRTAVADAIGAVTRVGSILTTAGASGRAVARVAAMSPNAGAVRG